MSKDLIVSMMFARDLVKYVWKHLEQDCKSTEPMFMDCEGDSPQGVCIIGKSVLNIMLLRSDIIYSCYDDLYKMNVWDDAEFGELVFHSVPHYFPSGYTHCGYIAFCSMAIGVAVYYQHLDEPKFLQYVVGIVGNVLIAFMLNGEFWNKDGWIGLQYVSRIFNAGARKILNSWTKEDFKSRCKFVFQKEIDLEDLDED